jgi:hypothetical protein
LSPGRPRSEDVERAWQGLSHFDSFCYQMRAETQINHISAILPATPEKFMQYHGFLGRLNYFTFSIWMDRRLRLTVQQPTAWNEFLRVHRLVELNHAVIMSIIPNRVVRMAFIYSAVGNHAFALRAIFISIIRDPEVAAKV